MLDSLCHPPKTEMEEHKLWGLKCLIFDEDLSRLECSTLTQFRKHFQCGKFMKTLRRTRAPELNWIPCNRRSVQTSSSRCVCGIIKYDSKDVERKQLARTPFENRRNFCHKGWMRKLQLKSELRFYGEVLGSLTSAESMLMGWKFGSFAVYCNVVNVFYEFVKLRMEKYKTASKVLFV